MEVGKIMGEAILSMKDITKVYPNGIVANNRVNFSIEKGEIHALVGENGAGKSTLMKILFGLESPEEGEIILNGKKLNITSPNVAIMNGIGMVHQHFMLVPSLTVAENIVLGSEPRKGKIFLDMEKAIKISEDLAEKYNFDINVKELVKDIPVGTKQKVEILKALLRGAEILILDEPTAVLTPQETEELFKELLILKEKGYTIIFISHKLEEVKHFCDRITIMRNGRNVGLHFVKDVTEEDISRLMVGRDVILTVNKSKAKPKEVVLKVQNLTYVNEFGKKALNNISFSVRNGEILGVAGVEGNGQRELVETITGLLKCGKNKIFIEGQDISVLGIKEIRNLGTSHIPEDRMTYGVAEHLTIEQNLISNTYDKKDMNKGILMDVKKIIEITTGLISDYKIKCNSPKQTVKMLSGGNIQKVVVAREFSTEPKLLVADQPTRGIDVGATEFIRNKLVELRDDDSAVLLISADLNEVMELSDSLIVMYEGKIAAYFEDTDKVTEQELGLYMLGVRKQSDEEVRGVVYE
jgi:simple sugar transport system ATP-binding protein